MTTQDGALELAEPSKVKWRQYAVTAGRIGLAVLLLLAWKIGAERAVLRGHCTCALMR